MQRYGVGLVFVVAFAFSSISSAQIVSQMTPENVRNAIQIGMKSKDLGWYRLKEPARFSWPPLVAFYSTPFLRVALAANVEKKQYKTFTEADVTPEMIESEIVVFAPSHAVEGTQIANVESIVLLPHNSKDPGKAIHPTKTNDAVQEYKNLLGFTGEGKGVIAVFPISVWTENADVHVVFDQGIPSERGSGSLGGCTDCKVYIQLKNVH